MTAADEGSSTPSTLSNLGSRYQEVSSKAFTQSYLCKQFADSLGADVPGDNVFCLPICKEWLTALGSLSSAVKGLGLETLLAGVHAPRTSATETGLLAAEHVETEPESAAGQDPVDALTETLKTTSLTSPPALVPSPTPNFESLAFKYANSPLIFRVQDSSSHTNHSDQLGFTAGLFQTILGGYTDPRFAEMFCSHLHRKPIASPFISTGTDLRFSVRGLHNARRDKKTDVKLMIIDSSKPLWWKTNAGEFLQDQSSVKQIWEAGFSPGEKPKKWTYHRSEVLVWGQIPAGAILATISLVDLERAVKWGVEAEVECIRSNPCLGDSCRTRVWENLERALALQCAWRGEYVDFPRVISFIKENGSKSKAKAGFPWDDMGILENSLPGLAGAIQRMLNVRDPEAGLFLMGVFLGWVVGYQPEQGGGPKNCWDLRMGGVTGVKKLWESWSEAERLWREAEEEERRVGSLIYDRRGALPVYLSPSKWVCITCPSCGACPTSLGPHAQRCGLKRCLCVRYTKVTFVDSDSDD